MGNSRHDVPIWREARGAFAVNASKGVLAAGFGSNSELAIIGSRANRLRAFVRAIRPHQWAKNGLLLLPALAGHIPWTIESTGRLLAGVIAFSLVASAVYLINDLADLPHDRSHPTKRLRPLAAGDLPIPWALGGALALIGAATALSFTLPVDFQLVLGAYFLLTLAYSFHLKSRIVADVITLSTLYAARVVAGAAILEIRLTRWFLAFSIFFFFSLALLKRVTELRDQAARSRLTVGGRTYAVDDIPVLTSLGSTAVGASSLVYCLYIAGPDVNQLYQEPDLLWLGLPILLYWQARIWLLAGRGRVHEDPVMFALRDRLSYLLMFVFLGVLWFAT